MEADTRDVGGSVPEEEDVAADAKLGEEVVAAANGRLDALELRALQELKAGLVPDLEARFPFSAKRNPTLKKLREYLNLYRRYVSLAEKEEEMYQRVLND